MLVNFFVIKDIYLYDKEGKITILKSTAFLKNKVYDDSYYTCLI